MAVTKEEAKAAVLELQRYYGHIGDDVMEAIGGWNPEVRRLLEESFLAKDRLAAHSIKTLANNVYGSDARFVFELLQNADDNKFEEAEALFEAPYISFKVHPNRIVVECNEDGFRIKHLNAICAVGQSTKSDRYGYIGAKGIGFKSVFIAAWKVYIQSGNFSFYFKLEKDDPGLGMVRPIWQDTDEELPDNLTRMTLYLHEEGDPDDLEHLRTTIFKQLEDLQETCLLFLNHLEEIRIAFYDESGALEMEKTFEADESGDYHRHLETITRARDGEETRSSRIYHVTKHSATGLAGSNNREAQETEEGRVASSTAEVVLAFPLSEDFEPVVEFQHVFAFLPVRQGDFKFIIQSDFDTSANRQDIVTSSRRNEGLLDGIADAFVKAVLQFCEDDDLCYAWPLYLPFSEGINGFWAGLVDKMRSRLSNTPILRSRHGTTLRRIEDVRCAARNTMDENGDCLFDDRALDPFIAKRYGMEGAIMPLKGFGLKVVNRNTLLTLLRADLDSQESRVRSYSTSDDWHARMAAFCINLPERSLAQVRELDILPLRDGRWVSANSGVSYLPMTGEASIPPGVDMRVLDPQAVANASRKSLFLFLGAEEPSNAQVRHAIIESYSQRTQTQDLATSKAHLRYLYLTHSLEDVAEEEWEDVHVYDEEESPIYPLETDVYLASGHPYGPEALFSPSDRNSGLRIPFLHSSYLEGEPNRPGSSHPGWKEWLSEFIGIRDRLRLLTRSGDSLSDTFEDVAYNRPEKFLGLLQHLWEYEGQGISSGSDIASEIGVLPAGALCTDQRRPFDYQLSVCYLPLSNLRAQCARYIEGGEKFPFLNLLGDTSDEQIERNWGFLHSVLGVYKNEDKRFFRDILRRIQAFNREGLSTDRIGRLVGILLAIEAISPGDEDEVVILSCFRYPHLVPIPAFNECPAKWADPLACRWEGPKEAYGTSPLRHLYENIVLVSQEDMEGLSRFFKQDLLVADTSWKDVVDDLKALKETGCTDFDRIAGLYRYLEGLDECADSATQIELRGAFENSGLVHTPGARGCWSKPSHCLWSSATEIRGAVALSGIYAALEGLEEFFVGTLGVRTLTAQMLYDDLVQASAEMTVDEVKDKIWQLATFLEPSMAVPSPGGLLGAPVFPVRSGDGSVSLRPASADFAIIDREHLAARFEGRIKVLDYTLEEVRRLKPFLEWAGLQGRYLSACVKEITSISDGRVRSISTPNRDIKRKAHAILRIAATFGSPRYRADAAGLYELLRKVEVMETNGISSILKISQNGESFEAVEPLGDLHIEEPASGLKIFVPMDGSSQEFCFGCPLPERMTDWLMWDPHTHIREPIDKDAVAILTTVLGCDPSNVHRHLQFKGIVPVHIPNRDPAALTADTQRRGSTTPGSWTSGGDSRGPDTPPPSVGITPAAERSPPMEAVTRQTRMVAAASPSRARPVRSSPPREQPSFEDTRYRELLGRVISAARRYILPTEGAFDMAPLLSALPGNDTSGYDGTDIVSRFRSSSQLERDKKIGAAGELFVFELFSALSLTGWSLENWQSTIRQYVTVHPNYEDMTSWHGRETADFVYDDASGDLTEILVGNGYLNGDTWQGARPKYFLEVKSTTGPCETPFYMSKSQYQRMRSMYAAGRDEVYVILRVFRIESGNVGLRVYANPEEARVNGRLVFTGETWSVAPSAAGVSR